MDIFNTFEELYDFEECVPQILFLKLVVPQCPIVRGSHGLSAKVRNHEGPLARSLAPGEPPRLIVRVMLVKRRLKGNPVNL